MPNNVNEKKSIDEENIAIYIEPNKRVPLSMALFVALFSCIFSFRAFGIAIPHIIAKWDAMNLFTLGTSIMSVSMMVATIVVARISPRIGLKPTITFGLVLLVICNILIMFAPNMNIFILLRIISGIGNGVIIGQMAATINKIWPD